VELASRIAGPAEGEKILVSSLLNEPRESAGDIQFSEGREVKLKGLIGKQRVFGVAWE
jgi:predicted nucleotidyltransferase